jgi:AhpD family alkylhydroperoxidase
MTKEYKEVTKDINHYLAKLREECPELMAGFGALSKAATKDGALDKKTKELMALALGVASHCDGCIGFHSSALVRLGCTREELVETLGMAIYMGGGPSLMYAAEALKAFEEFSAA